MRNEIKLLSAGALFMTTLVGCSHPATSISSVTSTPSPSAVSNVIQEEVETVEPTLEPTVVPTPELVEEVIPEDQTYYFDESWSYASYSAIHTGSVTLYRAQSDRKNIVIAVNAGHGTQGGSSVYTQCHPDGSAKVTGGSTAAGSYTATAVSVGTTLLDGTAEATANLQLAQVVKQVLLDNGYDVLMIRDSDDVQLDNIARTVFANNLADCHIALHYDSTETDKGAFYMSVPDVASYRSMEPVASHYQQHLALGESIISGLSGAGVKIFGSGSMAIDLTQTSYSTIPSIDVEVGDRASDHSESVRNQIAQGILSGINIYFGQQ